MQKFKTDNKDQCTGGITTIMIGDNGSVLAKKISKVSPQEILLTDDVNYIGQDIGETVLFTGKGDEGYAPVQAVQPVRGDGKPHELIFAFVPRTPAKHQEDAFGEAKKAAVDPFETAVLADLKAIKDALGI